MLSCSRGSRMSVDCVGSELHSDVGWDSSSTISTDGARCLVETVSTFPFSYWILAKWGEIVSISLTSSTNGSFFRRMCRLSRTFWLVPLRKSGMSQPIVDDLAKLNIRSWGVEFVAVQSNDLMDERAAHKTISH